MNSPSTPDTNTFADTLTNLGGQGIVAIGLSVISSTIALIISSLLVGFWMSVLLWLLSLVITLVMTFLAPSILDSISDETYQAIGTKAGAALSWVTDLFASKDEAASPAA